MVKALLKNHQLLKWLLIIAAGFLLVFGSVSFYLNIWVKPIIAKRLKQLVLNSTDQLYHIDFSGISVDCLTGDAHLANVKFLPDTAVLRKLILLKKAPNNVYYVQLKKLSIRNVHPLRIFREKKLNIDQIEVNRPQITMVNKQYDFNENRPPRPRLSPYDFVSRFFKEVRIDSIRFNQVSFKYIDQNQAVPVIDSLENLNVTLKDWLIDVNSAKDTSRFYLLKEVVLNLQDYSFATADSLYRVKVDEINFTSSRGALSIKQLSLIPRYSEMEFGKIVGHSKDRFSIQMSNLDLKGIDLPLYVKKHELFAREMNVKDGNISVFNNNELKSQESIKTGQYPHQLLQKLNAKITVKKLALNNINISYSEFDRDSKQKGRITFEKTSGTVTNITNVAKEKKRNHFMEANLNTLMMGQGKMDVQFKFNLVAADGAFTYAGTLHGLNGSVLNSVTKPLGLVHIKNGMVKKLSFNVAANDYKAVGNMEFRYNDLGIAVLKREEGKSWLSRQGLLSFLANNLVIKPDNPDKLGIFRPARIDYIRAPTRSFFNFIWRSLFQGIRYSVGVTPQKEASIKAQVAKFEKMKADREKRKEAREKRKLKNRT